MVEVIEAGYNKVNCERCNSVLRYSYEDITKEQVYEDVYQTYIVCTVCGNSILVQPH